jgi:hypothetical protein
VGGVMAMVGGVMAMVGGVMAMVGGVMVMDGVMVVMVGCGGWWGVCRWGGRMSIMDLMIGIMVMIPIRM